jgi:hypothetical protein
MYVRPVESCILTRMGALGCCCAIFMNFFVSLMARRSPVAGMSVLLTSERAAMTCLNPSECHSSVYLRLQEKATGVLLQQCQGNHIMLCRLCSVWCTLLL